MEYLDLSENCDDVPNYIIKKYASSLIKVDCYICDTLDNKNLEKFIISKLSDDWDYSDNLTRKDINRIYKNRFY